MRNRKLTEYFFTLDARHSRVDIGRPLLALLSLAAVAGWALVAPADQVWEYALSAAAFLTVTQFILGMLAASNLSMLLVSLVALAIFGLYTPAQLSALSTFLAIVGLAQIYLVAKGKLTGLAVAIVVGLLATGEGRFAVLAVALFGLLLVGRIIWHVIFERMTKKIWIMFSAKAVAMIVLAAGLVLLLDSRFTFPWVASQPLPWPEVHWLVWAVLALVGLRGMWGTILLRTKRSPQNRGFRLFCIFFGVAVLAVLAALNAYGSQLFLPSVMESLRSLGILGYSPEVLTVVIIASLLIVSAGIDRSLFRNVRPTPISD